MSLKPANSAAGYLRDQPHKGRGAALNLEGRFEQWRREAFADGWESAQDQTEAAEISAAAGLKTIVTHETAKSIISENDSPDIPFRYSLNPYRGCEHGCIYCFARPSHAYLGLSPGLDFETRIFAKINAPLLLRKELSTPRYRCDVISLGINTDAYQPCEREYALTRQCLEVMSEFNQPVALITERPNIFAMYEQNIGPLTPLLSDILRDAENTYPTPWIDEAMRIAVENNIRNWKYCEAILKRWTTDGKTEKKPKPAESNGGAEQNPYLADEYFQRKTDHE